MSTKRANEAIQSEDEPATKQQKPNTSSCLLIESSPEVLRNVYSFLMLKDALELSRTCRQLRNNTNDIFRYSCIMDYEGFKKQGVCEDDDFTYLNLQKTILCNPVSLGNLRSVLRNETLPQTMVKRFIFEMILLSKTDNGEALSILLQDSRCNVGYEQLEDILKKDFTNMGEALERDERIAKDIKVCGSCNDGIGIYPCGNLEGQCIQWGLQYCRCCALKANRFCDSCDDYLCPSCLAAGNFCSCEKCHGIWCLYPECAEYVERCDHCDRRKCTSCIEADSENWDYLYNEVFDLTRCPTCQRQHDTNESVQD